jgi:hypothetical protein
VHQKLVLSHHYYLKELNLARRAITKFTTGLDDLAIEVTGLISKTGDVEKSFTDLSIKNRTLAEKMLARNLDPAKEFIAKPVSSKVSGIDLTDDQIKIAEYLHEFYSRKQAIGIKKPTLFRELFSKLKLGNFDESILKNQLVSFKQLIDQQEAHFKGKNSNNPLPGIHLEGVKAGSSEDSGERRNVLFGRNFFQTLKSKFKDNLEDIDLTKLKDYRLAVVDFLLGSVARYYDTATNRRTDSVTKNLNAQNGSFITLVKSIDYFLKLS